MSLTREQFLLTKLAEECNEVAQMALKTQQFGKDEVKPDQLLTNGQRLRAEIIDLLTMACMLIEEFDYDFDFNESDINAKVARIAKYYKISQERGMVHD